MIINSQIPSIRKKSSVTLERTLDLPNKDMLFFNGDTIDLKFTYGDTDLDSAVLMKYVARNENPEELQQQLSEIEPGEVSWDVTQYLLLNELTLTEDDKEIAETGLLFNFRVVVTNYNGDTDTLDYRVIYNFDDIQDFIFQKENDNYTLTDYNGISSTVIIPKYGFTDEHGILPTRKIEDNTFQSNPDIQHVIIPPSIEEIGFFAFDNCPELAGITIYSDTPPLLASTNVFEGESGVLEVFVPDDAVSTYESAATWSTANNDTIKIKPVSLRALPFD